MVLLQLMISTLFAGVLAQYDCQNDTKFPLQVPGACGDFYICHNHERLEYKCRQDRLFNSYTKRCDPKSSVVCLPAKQAIGQMCPLDALTAFEADADSCNHYTSCIDGLRHQHKCPEGLLYSEATGVCDLASKVSCGGKSSVVATSVVGVRNDELCPSGEIGGFKSHPDSCGQYYNCISDLYYEYTCPGNSHFNPSTKSCDTTGNASCDTTAVPHPDCPLDAPHHPQANPENCAAFFICYEGTKLSFRCHEEHIFNQETMMCDIHAPNGCANPDRCDALPDYTKLVHDTDCDKYYKCLDSVSIEMTCPESLHFNAETERCEKPEDADCTIGVTTTTEETTTEDATTTTEEVTTTEEPTTTEAALCSSDDDYVTYPHEEDCSLYYICVDQQAVVFQCPIPLQFNSVLEMCMKPEHSDCTTGIICEDFTKSPDSESCTKYYQCMGNSWMEATCPDPLHFNVRHGLCDYVHKAGCTALGL